MAEPAKVLDGEAVPLRLKWRKTWKDSENDFVAAAPTFDNVGRIYLDTVSLKKGQWFWSLTADGPHISRNIGKTSGFEDTARLAGKAVEDAWFAAIKG